MWFAEGAAPRGLAAPGLHLPTRRGARRGLRRGAAPALTAAGGRSRRRACGVRTRLPGREERPGCYRPPLRGCGLAQCGAQSSSAGKGPGSLGRPADVRWAGEETGKFPQKTAAALMFKVAWGSRQARHDGRSDIEQDTVITDSARG